MLLVITSCINPPKQENLALTDPVARWKYTESSLNKIFQTGLFDKIVICDSSNFRFDKEIETLAKTYNVNLEILSFWGDSNQVSKQGKGYGEGEIMEYFINNSVLLKEEDSFFKITGRLYVENIYEIINEIKPGKNYFNITSLKFFKSIDTRFYKINKEDYIHYLLYAYHEVDDNNNLWYEVIFRNHLRKAPFSQFPILPVIRGVSGTHGKDDFNDDTLFKYKKFLTKIGLHNSMFGAVTSYIILKIESILNYEK